MLRTLGAGRGQILGSVVVEALAIGLLGALLGLAGGYVIAKGLNALFVAIGIDLPTTGLVTKDRTVVVSLLIGVGVTLVSSFVPALRSTRVPPIAALLALEQPRSRRRGIVYAAVAVLLGTVGLAMVLIGLFGGADGGGAAGLMGGGAVAVDPRRLALQPTPGAAACLPCRAAAGAHPPPHRATCPREHAAQSSPHRGDGGGTDDRPCRRRLRHRLRRRDQELDRDRGRRQLPGRARDPEHGRLLADLPQRGDRRRAQVPGVELVSTLRAAQAKLLSGGGGKPRVSALDRDTGSVPRIDWTEGGPQTLRDLTDGEVISRQIARLRQRLRPRRSGSLPHPDRRQAKLSRWWASSKTRPICSAARSSPRAVMARQFDQLDDVFDFVKLAPGADVGSGPGALIA